MTLWRVAISGASMSLRWGKGTFLSLLRPDDLYDRLKLGRERTYWAGQRCEAPQEAGAPVVLLQGWAKAVDQAESVLQIAGAGDLLGLNQLELLDDPWEEDTIAWSVARVLVVHQLCSRASCGDGQAFPRPCSAPYCTVSAERTGRRHGSSCQPPSASAACCTPSP